MGRFWKRQLSKIRRRNVKEEIRTDEPPRRYGGKVESECNYKSW
jgi:hypothetical protein